MSTVTLAQIFDIVDGPIDYINVNISLGQCIQTSLDKINDAINYTDSPFAVNMIYDSSSGDAEIASTSLVDFTSLMITQTSTFLTACQTALQEARVQQSSTTSSYTFLTSTFATAQEKFIGEYSNYLTTYQHLFTMVKVPSYNSTYTDVVSTTQQGITATLANDSFRPQYSTKWMSSAQLRIVRRVLAYLSDCFQTLIIIVAPTDAKYNSNSTLSNSTIGSITDDFSAVMVKFSSLHTEGSDFVDQLDDWTSVARTTDANIDLIQAPISAALTTFVDHVGNSKTGTITAVTINTAGTGYVVGDVLTLGTEDGGTAATLVVKTIGTGGTIATVEVVDGGALYTTSSTGLSVSGGSGSSAADAAVSAVANITSLFATIGTMNDSLAN